jgi:hypothetical protein
MIGIISSGAILSALLGAALPHSGEPASAAAATWNTPPPLTQVAREAQVIPWEKGTLFLPAMTDPDYEPAFSVYRDSQMLKVQRTGHSVVLDPGTYTVRWGSGDLTQRLERSVEVRAGNATVVDVDWSGLVIRAIDETRTTIGYNYEVVQLPTYSTFGVGHSAEEVLGEHQLTWLLPPGLYKIIPVGEDYSTIVNFTTVRLLPGELTHLSLVVDPVSGNLLGAGTVVLPGGQRGHAGVLYAATHANLLLDHQAGGAEGLSRQDFSFSGTGELRFTHDSDHYSLSCRSLLEEGLTHVQDVGWRILTDRFLARAVGVRKLGGRIGLYSRLFIENKVLPGRVYLDSPTEFMKIDRNGRVSSHGTAEELRLSPGGLPLTLQEGFGINLVALKTERNSLFLRTGYGFRQTINGSVFSADTPSDELLAAVGADSLLNDPEHANFYMEQLSSTLYGIEESLVFSGRLGKRILLGADLDVLLPQGGGKSIIDAEGTINFRLTKSISLYYSLRYLDDPAVAEEALVEGSARLRLTHVF